ncbi:hypothetical protein LSH36_155g04080 [Paralvinella palmiformis]|uniref:Uncharacterized protein n=1 Tax=Paralvinella palmiformis TaxID=53620 RepID=A0AAD9N8T9_9ANNE|nr:hypothetical protein LSH36_155g04080 [Paralvinella palmiformis]
MRLINTLAILLRVYITYLLSDIARAKNNASRQFLENLLQGVDARIRPPNADNGTVVVKVNLYVLSLSSISAINMEFTTDIYFREFWNDPRLIYADGPPHISLSSRFIDQIWTPDLYFPNEKSAKLHGVTMPNRLLRIFPDGNVVFSIRMTLVFSCPMEFEAFPMDTQTCAIKIESYAYETHELQLAWQDPPVEIDDELELPQFELMEINNVTCHKQYKTTGKFPCLKVTFSLYRRLGSFLLQVYIPSTLIIIVSCISFWINMDAVAARISLGVTTVLTMTTHLTGLTNSVPKVSYPKAIDIWMSMAMLFVFTALLEYAFVNAISRRRSKHDAYKKTDKLDESIEMTAAPGTQTCVDGVQNVPKEPAKRVTNYQKVAHRIDQLSRYIFPSIFLIFNIVYWPYYGAMRER